ncbi:TVP38/TMEM64 family protein [Bacillus daqingensis]|uniref:TVP38/TMEM64 family membrane protein n=1 Tax=Bacillus daqingensis TaxID=872396 RepID=A0ABV9NZH5_9BACI
MEELETTIFQVIEQAGWLAPIIFVLLHLFRPFLFLPVVIVCMAGGYFFGFVQGSLYSIAGLALMSAAFYAVVQKMPRFRERVARLKKKVFHDRQMTIGQVMILRMLPFIHFHLLSLYLMEMTNTFRRYMTYSVLGIILPAMLFTGFGHILVELSWIYALPILGLLAIAFFYLGRREERPDPMRPSTSKAG